MFALRGITVSFSAFLLVYVALSLVVCFSWRGIYCFRHNLAPKHCADVLFAIRMFPVLAAFAVTAVFTLPSFLLLEPRSIDEPVGGLPLTLGLCGIGLALLGGAKASAALLKTSRTIARWTRQATSVESAVFVPVLRIDRVVPALTAAGILRPTVLLSGAAEFVLNENELRSALNHEVAHVRRRDNLKKLLLLLAAFPGMRSLETAWLESTELAADDDAATTGPEALDLAAALIKLAQMSAWHETGLERNAQALMTAFTHGSSSLTNARVERLIAWSENRRRAVPKNSLRSPASITLLIAITTTLASAFAYSHVLAQVHSATEWLVR